MKLVHLYKHLRVCHESTLWTNVSVILDLYTPTLSLFLLPLPIHISIIRFILHSPHLLSAYIWPGDTYVTSLYLLKIIFLPTQPLKPVLICFIVRPVIFELWQDGNGVDGETLTWVPLHGGKLRYHVETKRPVPRTMSYKRSINGNRVYISSWCSGSLREGGPHKPVLAPPHVFTHEPRRSSRPIIIVESEIEFPT